VDTKRTTDGPPGSFNSNSDSLPQRTAHDMPGCGAVDMARKKWKPGALLDVLPQEHGGAHFRIFCRERMGVVERSCYETILGGMIL